MLSLCLPAWYSMAGAAAAASARAARAGRNSSASGASSSSLNALEAGARVFDIAWAACQYGQCRGSSAAFSGARTPEHALPSLLDRAMASVCIAQAAWVPLRVACAGEPCYARTARGGSAGLPDVGGCLRPSAVSWGTVTLHTHWSSQPQARRRTSPATKLLLPPPQPPWCHPLLLHQWMDGWKGRTDEAQWKVRLSFPCLRSSQQAKLAYFGGTIVVVCYIYTFQTWHGVYVCLLLLHSIACCTNCYCCRPLCTTMLLLGLLQAAT